MLSSSQYTEEELREIIQGPSDVEWKYEMRRECQEILPNLLLGPFQVSKSRETLTRLKVTHMYDLDASFVCIRDSKESFAVRPRFSGEFEYLVLDVEDNENQNLIRLFPLAEQFISNALTSGGRVLVHCNGGISLSPAFVVMYVMQHYQMSWEDALHTVQNRRYCISPNGGFLTQIKEYESIYRANIAVKVSSPRGLRRKRDDREDEEVDDPREDEKKRVIRQSKTSTNVPAPGDQDEMET